MCAGRAGTGRRDGIPRPGQALGAWSRCLDSAGRTNRCQVLTFSQPYTGVANHVVKNKAV